VRTTVTLDADVEVLLKRLMRERGLTLKQAINESIRAGATAPRDTTAPVTFPTYDMGAPHVDLTKALELAGRLEDDELVRRLARGT
jgi:hypothetical protein